VFNLAAEIKNIENADENEKYVYIEDKHAIGDLDLLNNEATKGENTQNICTYIFLFGIILVAVCISCYLNYYFPSTLA